MRCKQEDGSENERVNAVRCEGLRLEGGKTSRLVLVEQTIGEQEDGSSRIIRQQREDRRCEQEIGELLWGPVLEKTYAPILGLHVGIDRRWGI